MAVVLKPSKQATTGISRRRSPDATAPGFLLEIRGVHSVISGWMGCA